MWKHKTPNVVEIAELLTICLVITQLAIAGDVRKFAEIDDGASDYTNHVAAFEPDSIGFEKLEEYLQDNVKDESIKANLEAAEKLLHREELKLAFRDVKLLQALKMFTGLEKLLDKSTCNHWGHQYLMELKAASKYRIDRRVAKRRLFFVPSKRIELIIARFAREHAKQCKDVYPENFAKLYNNLDLSKLDVVDALMNEVIRTRLVARSSSGFGKRDATSDARLKKVYVSFIEMNESFKKPEDAKMVKNFVNRMLDNSEEKMDEHHQKHSVKGYFQELILNPCNQYLQVMSSDVFVPAQLDSSLMDKIDRYKPSSEEHRNGFIFGWSRFGFCGMLLRDKDILVKNLMSP